MRNVSDKTCRQNQIVNFMFHNVLLKVVPFMRQCGTAGQATGDKTAQAFCMLAKAANTQSEYVTRIALPLQ
jgi:hypothetical protein